MRSTSGQPTQSADEGFERYIALYHTPWRHGGCQGCRFFAVCKGQCPGTALGADWRNRSASCALWTAIFTTVEADLIAEGRRPLSQRPDRVALEAALIGYWVRGRNPTLAHVVGEIVEAVA